MLQSVKTLEGDEEKCKRYTSAMDGTLSSFQNMTEWPDLISFLSKLSRCIQQFAKQERYLSRKVSVTKRLAQCLNPALPTGVHQKAVEVYDLIFASLELEYLKTNIHLLTLGLFPAFHQSSTSVRLLLLQVVENRLLPMLSQDFQSIGRPLLVALLPLLEETATSNEFFDRTLKIVQSVQAVVGDYAFSQQICLLLATWQPLRLGALQVVLRNAALFSSTDSTEIQIALANCLASEEILTARNSLEAVISCVPIAVAVEQLTVAVLETLLRKNFSLTRRVYGWIGVKPTVQVIPEQSKQKLVDGLLVIAKRDFATVFKISIFLLDLGETVIGPIIEKILAPVIREFIHRGGDMDPHAMGLVEMLLRQLDPNFLLQILEGDWIIVPWMLEKFPFTGDLLGQQPKSLLLSLIRSKHEDAEVELFCFKSLWREQHSKEIAEAVFKFRLSLHFSKSTDWLLLQATKVDLLQVSVQAIVSDPIVAILGLLLVAKAEERISFFLNFISTCDPNILLLLERMQLAGMAEMTEAFLFSHPEVSLKLVTDVFMASQTPKSLPRCCSWLLGKKKMVLRQVSVDCLEFLSRVTDCLFGKIQQSSSDSKSFAVACDYSSRLLKYWLDQLLEVGYLIKSTFYVWLSTDCRWDWIELAPGSIEGALLQLGEVIFDQRIESLYEPILKIFDFMNTNISENFLFKIVNIFNIDLLDIGLKIMYRCKFNIMEHLPLIVGRCKSFSITFIDFILIRGLSGKFLSFAPLDALPAIVVGALLSASVCGVNSLAGQAKTADSAFDDWRLSILHRAKENFGTSMPLSEIRPNQLPETATSTIKWLLEKSFSCAIATLQLMFQGDDLLLVYELLLLIVEESSTIASQIVPFLPISLLVNFILKGESVANVVIVDAFLSQSTDEPQCNYLIQQFKEFSDQIRARSVAQSLRYLISIGQYLSKSSKAREIQDLLFRSLSATMQRLAKSIQTGRRKSGDCATSSEALILLKIISDKFLRPTDWIFQLQSDRLGEWLSRLVGEVAIPLVTCDGGDSVEGWQIFDRLADFGVSWVRCWRRDFIYEVVTVKETFWKVQNRSLKTRLISQVWQLYSTGGEASEKLCEWMIGNSRLSALSIAAGNVPLLFTRTSETEAAAKCDAFHQLACFIFCAKRGWFLGALPALLERIAEAFKAFTLDRGSSLYGSIFLLIRCMLLRFEPESLGNLWPILFTELYCVFQNCRPLSDTTSTSSSEDLLKIGVLRALQVIDTLFTIRSVEYATQLEIFQFSESEFIFKSSHSNSSHLRQPQLGLDEPSVSAAIDKLKNHQLSESFLSVGVDWNQLEENVLKNLFFSDVLLP